MDSSWDQNAFGNQESRVGADVGRAAILQLGEGSSVLSAQTEIRLAFWLWHSMFKFSKGSTRGK